MIKTMIYKRNRKKNLNTSSYDPYYYQSALYFMRFANLYCSEMIPSFERREIWGPSNFGRRNEWFFDDVQYDYNKVHIFYTKLPVSNRNNMYFVSKYQQKQNERFENLTISSVFGK